MSDKDGGPAFPGERNEVSRRGHGYRVAYPGMSLRDYFAAKAMQALIGSEKDRELYEDHAEGAAHDAYCYADAMLEERLKHAEE